MASTINKVILVGNVGKDPDVRFTQNNSEIANLSLATSESWKDKMTGERKEKTEWHKVVIFVPQLVQIIKERARKGSKLYVEGSLQTRKWVDTNGVEKYITEIVVQSYSHTIVLLDGGEARDGHDGHAVGRPGPGGSGPSTYDLGDLHGDVMSDEIPF